MNASNGLRSEESRVPVYLTFVNKTHRRVYVIWVNYQGSKEAYRELGPNDSFNINTFETHPWICQDVDAGDLLLLNRQEAHNPSAHNSGKPVRQVVNITIPVFTLETRCLQVIRSYLKSGADLYQLHLPILLQHRLADPF